MRLKLNRTLRAALLAAITAVATTLPQSFADATVITLGEVQATSHDFVTDAHVLNNSNGETYSLQDGSSLAMWRSGGKFWGTSSNGDGTIAGTWTNTTALEELNSTIGTSFTAADFSAGNNYCYTASGAGYSKATLTLGTSLYEPNANIITLYTTVTRRGDSLSDFSVSGLDDCEISYATNGGTGFSDSATFSSSAKNITLIKVTGVITGSPIELSSEQNTNGWQTISYIISAAPTPAEDLTWAGTADDHVLTHDLWNNGTVETTPYSADAPLIFGTGGHKIVTIGENATAKSITVQAPGYSFDGAATLTAKSLAVETGATLALTGSGTLVLSGSSVTIADAGALTVGATSTLKVNAADVAKTLMKGKQVTNNGIFEITGNVSLGNGESTQMGGTLAVKNATVTLGTGEGTTASIESFSHVSLDGGQITVNAQNATVNGVSVASGKTGTVKVEDMQNSPKTVTLAGVTKVDGTLNLTNNWNSSFTIDQLSGAGTLSQPAGGQQEMVLTINSLQGFTGSMILKHNKNKDAININTGATAVNFKALELAIGGHTANFTLGADTGIEQMTLTSGTLNFTGAHTLTVGGVTGSGPLNVAGNLTFNGTGTSAYTGTLTVGGQIVKQGEGSQTITGYEMHKAISVQNGELVLKGDFAIDYLGNDPDTVTTYQDAEGHDTTVGEYGFKAQQGFRTVYTKDGGALTLAEGARFTLDGETVTLEENGKYKLPSGPDYTTLWVKGNTALSYDAYYEASGEETKALTTAKVADGATLAIGTNAVGTLAFQENGTTINLPGIGTVNAISGTGTLNLLEGAEVTYNIPGGNANFTTTGKGTLKSGGFTLTGGTVSLGSNAALSGQVSLYSGKFIIGGDTNIDGSLKLGESSGNTAEVTVNEGAKLTVDSISSAWGFKSMTVNGALNVEGELRLSTGAQDYTIAGSGIVNTNKLTLANVGRYHVDGTSGLTLEVGSGGVSNGGNNHFLTFKDLKVTATDDWSATQDIMLDGTLTLDTNSHDVTISSVLSDASGKTGGITKNGEGTLTLSGTNTYTGTTMVNGGTLDIQGSIANSTVKVADDATLAGNTENISVGIAAGKTATITDEAGFTPKDSGVTFYSDSTGVEVKNTGDAEITYGIGEEAAKVTADRLGVVSGTAVTVKNEVVVWGIANFGEGDLTLTHVNVERLESVNAYDGDLTLQNIAEVSLDEIEIASGSTVAVYKGAVADATQEGTVTITEKLMAGGGTLLANLKMADGSKLAVNGGDENALTLGSQFTIAEGALVRLDDATLAALDNLAVGGSLTLIKALDQTTLGYGQDYAGTWYDAMFSRVDKEYSLAGDFQVFANETGFGLTKVSNVPEPTTGTLSLLALAALCMRRRRK